MSPYWELIVKPVLERIDPQVIVEVGSDQGKNTIHLAEFCRKHRAVLNAIDPVPHFDVAGFENTYGESFRFHRDLSLNALPKIEQYDVVILDGDHNWYTVYHELKVLETHTQSGHTPFPFVFFHDVGWPYARRDSYYDPENIPAEFRHPYARKGVLPDHTELLEVGGMNSELCNALEEGTPRNGVLTAIEDFLKQTGEEVEFLKVPGLFGLGMLIPAERVAHNQPLADFISFWRLPDPVIQYLEELESCRLENLLWRSDESIALRRLIHRREQQIRRLQTTLQSLVEQIRAIQS